jgi:pimeloyl-ACP methyl ester carboxylesterase
MTSVGKNFRDDVGVPAGSLEFRVFAWAINDKINRLADIESVIQQMRNARLVKFDGGHAAFLERPEQFVQEFRKFIADAGVLGTGACPDAAMVT